MGSQYCERHEWPAGMGRPCPDCLELGRLADLLKKIAAKYIAANSMNTFYVMSRETFDEIVKVVSESSAKRSWECEGCGGDHPYKHCGAPDRLEPLPEDLK